MNLGADHYAFILRNPARFDALMEAAEPGFERDFLKSIKGRSYSKRFNVSDKQARILNAISDRSMESDEDSLVVDLDDD